MLKFSALSQNKRYKELLKRVNNRWFSPHNNIYKEGEIMSIGMSWNLSLEDVALVEEVKKQIDEINVEDYAQKSSVEKALLLHDTNDRVLPVEKSREVARKWPAAKLIEVTGTGHYKILGEKKVLDKVMEFLNH